MFTLIWFENLAMNFIGTGAIFSMNTAGARWIIKRIFDCIFNRWEAIIKATGGPIENPVKITDWDVKFAT